MAISYGSSLYFVVRQLSLAKVERVMRLHPANAYPYSCSACMQLKEHYTSTFLEVIDQPAS